jgi:hypothetical protein
MIRNKSLILLTLLLCGLISSGIISVVEAKTNEEIYQEKLAQLKPEDTNGHYQLGVWCAKNKLPKQARTQFTKVLELNPDHADAHKRLDHVKYQDKWQTPDELKAQGLEIYKGKWVPYEQAMKAQGYIKFEEQWVSPKEYALIKKLLKDTPPKGVIDKPGADSENLPWDNAREKGTEHFIVKTNLSSDALNDLCFILEYAHFFWQDFFGLADAKKSGPTKVFVTKDRTDFENLFRKLMGINPSAGSGGTFIPQTEPRNQLGETFLILPYLTEPENNSLRNCIHEGTHYTLYSISKDHGCPAAPQWLDEGLATYFEASAIKGNRLVTRLLNQSRLDGAKKHITDKNYIPLKEFINLSRDEHRDRHDIAYAEGWSLVYFLIHNAAGKYDPGFHAYFDAWKNKQIAMVWTNGWEIKNKPEHLKLFEECMGVPIDQLEQEWKEYILSLK